MSYIVWVKNKIDQWENDCSKNSCTLVGVLWFAVDALFRSVPQESTGCISSTSPENYYVLNYFQNKNEYATSKVREVAKRLQSPDPDQFTVYTLDQNEMRNADALNYRCSTILFSKSFSDALQGLPGAKYTPEEIEGVLGHEVGHGILRHAVPDNPKYDKLDGLRGEAFINMLNQMRRENEREADLFTVRDPEIAKGLVHRLMRDGIGQPPEVPHPLDTHPTDEERIAYLSRAIFETTRGDDLDLGGSCFRNGTAS